MYKRVSQPLFTDFGDRINPFYTIECLLGFLSPILLMLGFQNFSSFAFYGTFIAIFAHFIYCLFVKKSFKRSTVNFILLSLIISFSFFSVLLVSDGDISFDYLKKFIIFSATMMFIFICASDKINSKTSDIALLLNLILSSFSIVFYYIFNGDLLKYGTSDYATLGFTNPNIAGLWLTTCLILLVYTFSRNKNILFRLVIVVVIALLLTIILDTGCRSAILALAFMAVLWAFLLIKKNKKLGMLLSIFLTLFPLLFVFMYFILINSSIVNYFSFLEGVGKGLDSRMAVWQSAFDAVKGSHFFTGNYHGTGQSHMHSLLLEVMASYGVPVLITVILYVINIVRDIDKAGDGKNINIGLLCFFGVWFLGIAEASMIMGANALYIPSCITLALAQTEFDKPDPKGVSESSKASKAEK